MALRHVEFDAASAGGARAADLAEAVLETVRHVDLYPVRRAGHRVFDRLVLAFEDARDRHLGAAARHVELDMVGAKIGSSIFETISVTMWNSVPSAEFWPDRMPNSAARWASV